MFQEKWTKLEESSAILDPKDLPEQERNEDYEREAELTEEERRNLGYKKLNIKKIDLSGIFRHGKN